MGLSTQIAESFYDSKFSFTPGTMSGVVCVFTTALEKDNPFFIKSITFNYGAHIEQELMIELHKKFGEGLNTLPANSKIIFYQYWSPCRTCTDATIPDFLRRFGLIEKNIRVKFRFIDYYSKANVPNSTKQELWETNAEAQQAYDIACISSGHAKVKTNPTTPNQTIESMYLVIAPVGNNKTSFLMTVHQ
ncbi:hypothetical protein [Pseudomonas fluorescens]|nr:hypothetical protein [Pseudomonas fluorescens]